MSRRKDATRASRRASQFRAIGFRLAEARRAEELTQASLAEEVGVSASTVRRWENGDSCPDAAQLVTISAIVGVAVSALLEVD